jgi:hypothetical protein
MRVVPGSKGPGDLRIEWLTPEGWRPIEMGAMFLLADFFAENEDTLSMGRDHWRQSAYQYLLTELASAMREGWRVPTEKIRRQRRKAA